MSFMDEFEEASSGIEVDLSQIPGFTETEEHDETPQASSPQTDSPGANEPDAAKYVPREQFESLQSQMGELKDMLLAQATKQQAPQVQYIQQQPQQSPETLKAQLEQQYYADPVGFTARMAQQSAQNSFGNDLAMMREMQTENLITQFEQTHGTDPAFKAAQKHFKAQVAKVPRANLSRLTPQQVTEFLEISRDAALGKVYQEVIAKQRGSAPVRQAAPAYGGGGAAGGRTQAPTQGDADARLVKYLGLTDDDFAAIND